MSRTRVLITGAGGFLGQHIVEILAARGKYAIYTVGNSHDYYQASEYQFFADLREENQVVHLLLDSKPDVILHLAAKCGGIGANQEWPGDFFYDNMKMGMNLIHHAKDKVNKFVLIGTVCSYPKYCQIPFMEKDIWKGYPEETNAPYGIAKKSLMVMLNAYVEQYGMNGITVIPVNMYGPGDNFEDQTSHVIPALIKKMHRAIHAEYHENITIWGSGQPSREFLYVKDAARGIIDALEFYESSTPLNLGTGQEIKIIDLVEIIANLMNYTGTIFFDTTKPDGQPRRCLDVSRAKEIIGFEAQVTLTEGLRETINWYLTRCHNKHLLV
jgi:GDP-L-fucose synthase